MAAPSKKKATAKKKTVRKKKAAKKTGLRAKVVRVSKIRLAIEPAMRPIVWMVPHHDGRVLEWVRRLALERGVELRVPDATTEGPRTPDVNMYVEMTEQGKWSLVSKKPHFSADSVWIPISESNVDEVKTLRALYPFEVAEELTLAASRDTSPKDYEALANAVREISGTADDYISLPPWPPDTQTEAVPLHTDDPAKVDRLGRATFAEAVANHVRRILDGAHKDAGSLAIHLDGPWGSGKSSLLHMIARELQSPRKREGEEEPRPSWVVVEFNAWEQQDDSPPWMALLDKVYADAKGQLVAEPHDRSGFGLALRRFWQRFGKWRLLIPVAAVLAAGLLMIALFKTQQHDWPAVLTAIAASITGLVPLLYWLGRSVFPSTAKGAKTFAARQRNLADVVQTHYEELYDSLGVPIAIFLDDVDRCQPQAVVELLEGIQTMFRSRPVLFVVAGDRRWVSKCFQLEYEDFAKMIPNPGHRLGDLFVQKVFQLSVRVPRISEQMQEQYLAHLLQTPPESVLAEQKMEAQELFEDANTEEEVQSRYEEGLRRGLPMDLVGQQAARRSSEAEIQARTEHALQRHAHLFERNPRAMKRMLNYYSIARATLYIEGVSEEQVDQEQLVRWLAAATRWPLLTDCLRIDPKIIDLVGSTEIPADGLAGIEMHFDGKRRDTVRGLLGDTEVVRVLGSLTSVVVRRCAARLD